MHALFLSAQQGDALGGMVDIFDLLMLVMLLGCGIYGIYAAIRLKREQYLFPNKILYPGNCPPENCTDVGGFIDYIAPRVLIFGVLLLLSGAFYAVNAYVLHYRWLDYVMIVEPLCIFVWYILLQNRASKKFW